MIATRAERKTILEKHTNNHLHAGMGNDEAVQSLVSVTSDINDGKGEKVRQRAGGEIAEFTFLIPIRIHMSGLWR